MYIVTTVSADGRRAGCLMGFATRISIRPPRFLAGLSRVNHTFTVAADADYLAVHLIGKERRDLAELFGGRTGDEIDKFAECAWTEGLVRESPGLPILDDAAAWMCGRILERVPLGDHVGHLLEPVATEIRRDVPVVSFFDIRHLTPGHPA
ncbi:flavin reductase family protein [Rhodococcus triatomae]|nr:flavin reductase family protein [Rhodococcus triatomae]